MSFNSSMNSFDTGRLLLSIIIVSIFGKKIPHVNVVLVADFYEAYNGGDAFPGFPERHMLFDGVEACGKFILRHPFGFPERHKPFTIECPHGFSFRLQATIIVSALSSLFFGVAYHYD